MAATNREVWQSGTIVETRDVATDIRRIVIEVTNPAPAQPGSHIDVTVHLDGRQDTRSYSVIESEGGGRRLVISVLRAPNSGGGSLFMHSLRVGESIELTQPLQNFPLRVGAPSYLLLAGGIGITAVAEMARVLQHLGAEYTLVYVGRSRRAMAYLPALQERHGDRLVVHVDDEGTSLDTAALVDTVDHDTELYMCGPIRLMDAVRRCWADADLPPSNLRYETFGNSGWFDPEDFIVRIPRLRVETRVGTHQSMLQALEGAGVEMMSDCRKGECGLCEVKVLGVDGIVDHRDVFYSARQREANRRMCCCVSRVTRPPASATAGETPVLTIDVS
ncbi:MAG: PDR/VanB family oxidoreductase [Actinomycetota bacterium]